MDKMVKLFWGIIFIFGIYFFTDIFGIQFSFLIFSIIKLLKVKMT